MKILWTDRGWDDYTHWQASDAKIAQRINEEHRLIYRVGGSGEAQTLEIASCRFHYSK